MAAALFDRFLYGVCYYPEHWDASRHASDLARIAAAGFDYIRIGEGAWAYFEPEEGKYQFEVFDHILTLCRKHDLRVVFGTPTYCAPAWVARKYPEVLRENFNRIPMEHGSRRNFNYTSAKYLELSDKICTALAEHYKKERLIIAWQLDNEFNCHMDVSYAASDEAAFRVWLKARYGSIAKLNAAWGTAFWSQTYNEFAQVRLPHPTPTYQNPTHLLDEARFISDTVVAFAKRQSAILKKANPKWLITTNGLFANINGPDLAGALDYFSHDQYPLFWSEGDWTGYNQPLIQARSLSSPFGVLEQQSGPGGQMQYLQRTPRAGQVRLWAWQSIAHGAKLLSYFRWRTCPYGAEQHWHGLIDQDDRDTRRLGEAKLLGQEIVRLQKHLWDVPVARATAVMRDYDNDINDQRINTYTSANGGSGETVSWIAEFARRQVPVDLVWPGSDLRGYKVLVLPHLKIVDKALVEKVVAFAQQGGMVILGAQSGAKNRNCHVVEAVLPGLWRKHAGVEVEEWTALPKGQTRTAKLAGGDGRTISCAAFVERLKPGRGVEVLASWQGEDTLLAGAPAITRNAVGAGSIVYIGGYCPSEAIDTLADELLELMGIAPLVDTTPAVECVAREGGSAGKHRYLFLLNHSAKNEQVRGLPEKSKDLLTGMKVANGTLTLAAYGVAIVEA